MLSRLAESPASLLTAGARSRHRGDVTGGLVDNDYPLVNSRSSRRCRRSSRPSQANATCQGKPDDVEEADDGGAD